MALLPAKCSGQKDGARSGDPWQAARVQGHVPCANIIWRQPCAAGDRLPSPADMPVRTTEGLLVAQLNSDRFTRATLSHRATAQCAGAAALPRISDVPVRVTAKDTGTRPTTRVQTCCVGLPPLVGPKRFHATLPAAVAPLPYRSRPVLPALPNISVPSFGRATHALAYTCCLAHTPASRQLFFWQLEPPTNLFPAPRSTVHSTAHNRLQRLRPAQLMQSAASTICLHDFLQQRSHTRHSTLMHAPPQALNQGSVCK